MKRAAPISFPSRPISKPIKDNNDLLKIVKDCAFIALEGTKDIGYNSNLLAEVIKTLVQYKLGVTNYE